VYFLYIHSSSSRQVAAPSKRGHLRGPPAFLLALLNLIWAQPPFEGGAYLASFSLGLVGDTKLRDCGLVVAVDAAQVGMERPLGGSAPGVLWSVGLHSGIT
jgi:hypothetical protein